MVLDLLNSLGKEKVHGHELPNVVSKTLIMRMVTQLFQRLGDFF